MANREDCIRSIIFITLMVLLVVICSSCAKKSIIDYDEMTTAEILVRVTKCSEEQAVNIASVLEQCGATKLQDIRVMGSGGRDWILTYPEGELRIDFNNNKSDKKLQAVEVYNAVKTTAILYFDDVINDGVHIEDTYYGTLISPSSESQYYFDTTFSMIASVEDMLLIENKEYSYYSPPTVESVEIPARFDYDGKRSIYRRKDGIVYIGILIYGITEAGESIDFEFEAEFAMLHPVSFRLNMYSYAENPEEEMIDCVWHSTYNELLGKFFDDLRAEAADRTAPFTEDEIYRATQVMEDFINTHPSPSIPIVPYGLASITKNTNFAVHMVLSPRERAVRRVAARGRSE